MHAMLRGRFASDRFVTILLATVVSIACPACPSTRGAAPPRPIIDDTAVRIRVANAEARRGGGVAELAALAAAGAPHERVLALRGLGRIGGARALDTLRGALADRDPRIVAAAAAAIGVAASLDEPDRGAPGVAPAPGIDASLGPALVAALPGAGAHAHVVLEAIGRAGDTDTQATLAAWLARPVPAVAEAAAIALGRHGRRKLALADAARDALATATEHVDPAVRYAAVWALAREHLASVDAPRVVGVTAKLAARVRDDVPEIRAQAVAALARRKLARQTAPVIEAALLDRDWRVVVEAVRALAPENPEAVASALARQVPFLGQGDGAAAHVVIEGLRVLAPHAGVGRVGPTIASIRTAVMASPTAPVLARGWIECLAAAALVRADGAVRLDPCGVDALPAHHRLALLGELVTAKAGPVALRRTAVTTLLAHADPRVRAAGLAALPALWSDGDDADHRAAIGTVAAAIGARDPIVAGTAAEAATPLYEAIGTGDRSALDRAIVARAQTERDAELAASLFGLIGTHQIAAGAEACTRGLDGSPVLATAARTCLRLLGQAPPPPATVAAPPAPPVDVAAVIGKDVRWHLTTTRGELVIHLRPEVAPWAVATIVALTQRGYYDGLELHRVVPGFVVQGGDPTQSGWGGPGFTIPAEPASLLDGPGFIAGGVGIADAGRDSGGSQWFAMHARAPHLDGRYTWVGELAPGSKSANGLLIGDRVRKATVELAPRR